MHRTIHTIPLTFLSLVACTGEIDDSDRALRDTPVFAEDLEIGAVEPPPPTYPQYATYALADRTGSVAVGDDFNRTTSDVLGVGYGAFTWQEESKPLVNDGNVSLAADDYLSLQ